MLKTLTFAVLASGLALSTASAQKAQDRVPGFGPPVAASQPLDPARPDIVRGTIVLPPDEALSAQNKADNAKPPVEQAKADSAGPVIAEQQPDQWMTRRFTGTDVIDSTGTKVGDVKDVILNADGSLAAVLIGVGGFLGIGSKEVAVTFDSVKLVRAPEGEGNLLKLAMTKQQLDATAAFKRYLPPRPVADAGSQPQTPTN